MRTFSFTGPVPEEVSADMVSGNFFDGLGVRTAYGRQLSAQDEAAHTPMAEVSYSYATFRFGEACSAIGKPINIKGVPFTIVGVTASGFKGVEKNPTDVRIPFQVRPELNAWFPYSQVGHTGTLHVEVRTAGPATAAPPAVRAAVAEFAPDVALLQPRTQQAEFGRSISTEILLARLSTAFAALAVTLVTNWALRGHFLQREAAHHRSGYSPGAGRGAAKRGVDDSSQRNFALFDWAGHGHTSGVCVVAFFGVAVVRRNAAGFGCDCGAAVGILLVGLAATYLPARRAASIDPLQALGMSEQPVRRLRFLRRR